MGIVFLQNLETEVRITDDSKEGKTENAGFIERHNDFYFFRFGSTFLSEEDLRTIADKVEQLNARGIP